MPKAKKYKKPVPKGTMTTNLPPGARQIKAFVTLSQIPGMTQNMAIRLCYYLELVEPEDLNIFKEVQDPVVLYEMATEGMIITSLDRYVLMNAIRLAIQHLNERSWKSKIEMFLNNFPEMEYNTAKFLVWSEITFEEFCSTTEAAVDIYAKIVEHFDMSPWEGFLLVKNLEVVLGSRPASEFGPPIPKVPGI